MKFSLAILATVVLATVSMSPVHAQSGVVLGEFGKPTVTAKQTTDAGAIRVAYYQNPRGQFWYGASSRPDAAKAEEVAIAECLAHATDGRVDPKNPVHCNVVFSQDGGYAALVEGRHSATQVRGIIIEGSMVSLEDAVAKAKAKAGNKRNVRVKCISSYQRVWAPCPGERAANR